MFGAKYTNTFLVIFALLCFMLNSSGQDTPSDSWVGTWTKSMNGASAQLVVSADKTWEVEFTGDDEADVFGSYAISGKKITFTDKGGEYSSDASGVYEFKTDDTTLTFTIVDDPVNGRSMLVQGTWTRAGDQK